MEKKRIELLILDRDGVINEDSPDYIRSTNDWFSIASSLHAIAACNRAGIPVVVATNQSGVGRGYYTLEALAEIHVQMEKELAQVGGHVDGIYFCPHLPDAGCDCRKPKPGMLLQIAQDYPDAIEHAIFVGDSFSDWQAAQAAGVMPCLVATGKGAQQWAKHRSFVPAEQYFPDLAAVIEQLLGIEI